MKFINALVVKLVDTKDLKTFANVYSSVTFKLAYFNKY